MTQVFCQAYTVGGKDTIFKGSVPDPHLLKKKLAEGQVYITKNGLHVTESHII